MYKSVYVADYVCGHTHAYAQVVDTHKYKISVDVSVIHLAW